MLLPSVRLLTGWQKGTVKSPGPALVLGRDRALGLECRACLHSSSSPPYPLPSQQQNSVSHWPVLSSRRDLPMLPQWSQNSGLYWCKILGPRSFLAPPLGADGFFLSVSPRSSESLPGLWGQEEGFIPLPQRQRGFPSTSFPGPLA